MIDEARVATVAFLIFVLMLALAAAWAMRFM